MRSSRKSPRSKSRTFVLVCRRVCYPRLTLSKRAPCYQKLAITNIHSVRRSILYGTVLQHKLIAKPHKSPPQNNNGIPENYPDKRTNGLTQQRNNTTENGKQYKRSQKPINKHNVTKQPLTIRNVTSPIPHHSAHAGRPHHHTAPNLQTHLTPQSPTPPAQPQTTRQKSPRFTMPNAAQRHKIALAYAYTCQRKTYP